MLLLNFISYIMFNIEFDHNNVFDWHLFMIIVIIIIVNSYILVTLIKSTHEKLYAMYVEWTKLYEIENHSLFIWLLHAVETTRLRLCIKFVHVDHTLKNEYSSHFKLL